MPVSSVLIGGGGAGGCAAAVALARRGVEVTVVEFAREWPDAGTGIVVRDPRIAEPGAPALGGLDAETVADLRDRGIEARPGTGLVGFVAVDRHVEAELSDGRIENYDAVLVPGATWRLIASDAQRPEAIAAVTDALSAAAG
jgi:NADPH-dependent 2,4-dienoyl-CoA reductase/sulfur reductase-like enzyme